MVRLLKRWFVIFLVKVKKTYHSHLIKICIKAIKGYSKYLFNYPTISINFAFYKKP